MEQFLSFRTLSASALPALTVCADGSQEWQLNGRLHRLDGPAYIGADGVQQWYTNGLLHRDNAPAVIKTDGTQIWYTHGKRHRLYSPAIIRADGMEEWWVDGHNITYLSAHQKLVRIRAYQQVMTPASAVSPVEVRS